LIHPLSREPTVIEIPVTVSSRALNLARQPYPLLAAPIGRRVLDLADLGDA